MCSCQAVAVAVRGCAARSALGLTVYLAPQAAAAGGRGLLQAALAAVRQDRSLLDAPDKMPAALCAAAAAAAGAAAAGAAAGATLCEGAPPEAAAAAVQPSEGGGVSDVCGSGSEGEGEDKGDVEPYLDDYLRPPEVLELLQPVVVYLTVPALPRG